MSMGRSNLRANTLSLLATKERARKLEQELMLREQEQKQRDFEMAEAAKKKNWFGNVAEGFKAGGPVGAIAGVVGGVGESIGQYRKEGAGWGRAIGSTLLDTPGYDAGTSLKSLGEGRGLGASMGDAVRAGTESGQGLSQAEIAGVATRGAKMYADKYGSKGLRAGAEALDDSAAGYAAQLDRDEHQRRSIARGQVDPGSGSVGGPTPFSPGPAYQPGYAEASRARQIREAEAQRQRDQDETNDQLRRGAAGGYSTGVA